MSRQWNLIIDVERCDNCRNCFLATKDEHIGNEFPGYAAPQPARDAHWVDILGQERGEWPVLEARFMPVMCNHCAHPPCMAAAKDGAVSQRDDGIVIIDPVKSKGQRAIAEACPYGAVHWNAELEIPQAWIFDAHLLDQGWNKPRIESVCPNDVFQSLKVDAGEMRQTAAREGLEVLQPELGTQPRLWYRNLHLVNRCFVAGTVVAHIQGCEQCLEGAEAVLSQDGRELGRARSDVFGEFKIDRLQPGIGPCELSVRAEGRAEATRSIELLEESLYAGVIGLQESSAE